MSIPKFIHYCWFGRNPLTPLAEKCVASWSKFCPDYEIVLWDEDRFDINSHPFVKGAYEHKKWAFVSDYIRLYALYTEGGVYLDADAEIIKPLEPILEGQSAVTGYEEDMWIPAALMAAERGNSWIKGLLDYYDNRPFVKEDGNLDVKPNTAVITELSKEKFGFKMGDSSIAVGNVTLLPSEYLTPHKINSITQKGENKFLIHPQNTYVIHHFAGSWEQISKMGKVLKKIKAIARQVMPAKLYLAIKRIGYRNKRW